MTNRCTIRCTKCSTEFELPLGQVGPEGQALRCSVCGHMFYAEPEPEPDAAGPWRLATVEKHLFERSRLREIADDIEDSQLRPEDQISHTGQHWLKLGEIPELSPLFAGLPGEDTLPRVFKLIDDDAIHGLGPPPSFGTGVDEPAPVRRDRFDLGGPNDPLPEPALPTIDDDGPLPAPPQFDSPPAPRARAQRKTGGVAVASMLDAVTKAVAAPAEEPEEESRPGGSVRGRSQPILVADLARAAAQNVAAAVQRVDDQRAAERSLRESRAKLEEASGERRTGSQASLSAAAASTAALGRSEGSSAKVEPPKSATAAAVAAAVATAPPPAVTPTAATPAATPATSAIGSTSSDPVTESAVSESAITDPPKPPVVFVKLAEPPPERSGMGGVFVLVVVLVAVGVVFGVPGVRDRIFGPSGGGPVTPKGDPGPVVARTQPPEFAAARNALRNLGIRETTRALSGLERVIDAADSDPADVVSAKLIQSEVMLMRVLSSRIAVMLDPVSNPAQGQVIIDSDLPDAAALVEGLGGPADPMALARVRVLLALAQNKPADQALAEVPAEAPGSRELAALVLGAPLWQAKDAAVPSGLITSLQAVSNPTALHQSLLALALWRSGDDEGARKVLDGVLGRVGDMSAARALRAALDQSAAEKGEVLPPPPEPPVEAATAGPSDSPPETKTDPGTRPRPNPNPNPTPSPGLESDSVDVLIQTGCQKVRNGDATGGVKLLHQAVDKRGNFQHFELCMCLANGFLAQNNHDTALAWFKRAVAQSPASHDAIAGAARAAELAGPQKESVAREFYKKLLDLEPGNQAARNYLAKHGGAGDSTTPPPVDDVPELIPVGKKKSP